MREGVSVRDTLGERVPPPRVGVLVGVAWRLGEAFGGLLLDGVAGRLREREGVTDRDRVGAGVSVAVPVPVLDRDPVGLAVPVLVSETEPVPVPDGVTVCVPVTLWLVVAVPVLVSDAVGEAVCVAVPLAVTVSVVVAVAVPEAVHVAVLVRVTVCVPVPEAVCVPDDESDGVRETVAELVAVDVRLPVPDAVWLAGDGDAVRDAEKITADSDAKLPATCAAVRQPSCMRSRWITRFAPMSDGVQEPTAGGTLRAMKRTRSGTTDVTTPLTYSVSTYGCVPGGEPEGGADPV